MLPEHRNRGVGSALMAAVEAAVQPEVGWIMLSTATKNYKSILHFYIDNAGMRFWSARLFKRLGS